jgi:hypothetical protein
MTLPVVWLPEADADLKEARVWYGNVLPELGEHFAYAVEVTMTQEISWLPVLRWVPDVQNFNRIVLHAVGDDMR